MHRYVPRCSLSCRAARIHAIRGSRSLIEASGAPPHPCQRNGRRWQPLRVTRFTSWAGSSSRALGYRILSQNTIPPQIIGQPNLPCRSACIMRALVWPAGDCMLLAGYTGLGLTLWHPVAAVYVYDPAADTWVERAPMPTPSWRSIRHGIRRENLCHWRL